MALLFVKSLLVPRSSVSNKSYSLLPTLGQHDKNFREASFDSSSRPVMDEKRERTPSPSRTRRFDPRLISDATIGLSDGLTVPFALTAGLSALGDTNVVIYGGLAELIAGGISMGLGGYLGAKGEAQAYESAQSETRTMINTDREQAHEIVRATFSRYHFSDVLLDGFATELDASDHDLEDFLMRFHHQLPESHITASRAYLSACVIATAYFFGGLFPLLPYFFAKTHEGAFSWSVVIMAVALFAFGYFKTLLVGEDKKIVCLKGGIQMMVLGGVAAGAAIVCVKAVDT